MLVSDAKESRLWSHPGKKTVWRAKEAEPIGYRLTSDLSDPQQQTNIAQSRGGLRQALPRGHLYSARLFQVGKKSQHIIKQPNKCV